ncbi:hypothetical protein FYK55_18535 [Roseiconus nitratireducens]|uniref:PBP domain-containing protein n=1 Tax=Roseiconus nitratireducens TaxID=2605748 RepID=A0A5M6D0E1_9BACT|nr:substrate-binding domain-containing protein [Roseiconus nitratireducens]KAA5540914.1 hypothetical protein FYK55_18535 [Roseiconus nitratireducens]
MSPFARFGFLFPLFTSLILSGMSLAESPPAAATDAEASVEEIRAVLEAIDPYLPKNEVAAEVDAFGSTSMDTLAHGWAIGFKKFHPECKVVISAEGSETVFDRLAKNPTSVGMLSRPVTEEDLNKLRERGLKKPVAVMIAREALGIFVNEANPIDSVTYDQMNQLFCAANDPDQTITWDSVGVAAGYAKHPVAVIARGPESGTAEFIRDYLFRGRTMRPAAATFASNAKLIAAIENNPYAITISGLKCGSHGAKALHLRHETTEIPSTDHAILLGRYPLVRPFSLVLDVGQTDAKSIASREFVRYALSQAGQMQAILAGFFPFDPPTLRGEMLKVDFKGPNAAPAPTPN